MTDIESRLNRLQIDNMLLRSMVDKLTGDMSAMGFIAQRSGRRENYSPPAYYPSMGGEEDYPWKVSLLPGAELAWTSNMRVLKGRWTRGFQGTDSPIPPTTVELNCGANVYLDILFDAGVSQVNRYLCAVLTRTTQANDPRLCPTSVILCQTEDTTVASVKIRLGQISASLFYGGHEVLGKVDVTDGEVGGGVLSWTQYWTGGDITDTAEVLDSETQARVTKVSGERHTIERNPSIGERQGELQLFNADEAVKPKNIAVLSVRNYGIEPPETPPVMEMEWPAIDSFAAVGLSTIDVTNKGSPAAKVICLKNSDTISASGEYMGHLHVTPAGATLNWSILDTHETPTPSGKSIEIDGSARTQIYNWKSAATAFSAGTHDGILGRIASGNTAVILDPASLPYLPDDTPIPTVPPTNEPWPTPPEGMVEAHSDLSDVVAQTVLDDHRGGRIAVGGTSNAYIHADGDATRNAMTGVLGDHLNAQSVDPDLRTLDGETTAGSKGWKVTSTAAISLDNFETGALVVAGSVSVGADLQVDDTAFADKLVAASTADAVPDSAIRTDGGVFATGHVRSQAGFGNGVKDGITKTISWEDVNGQVHTLEIHGGIITDHTVT